LLVYKMDKVKVKNINNKYCCVVGCKSKKTKEISIHTFSLKDKHRYRDWQIKLRIGKCVTKTSYVCSLHFLPSDYLFPEYPAKKRILRKTAVPSQNIPKRQYEKVISVVGESRENRLNERAVLKAKAESKRCPLKAMDINKNIGTKQLHLDQNHDDPNFQENLSILDINSNCNCDKQASESHDNK